MLPSLCITGLLLATPPAQTELQALHAGDAAAQDSFGNAIALLGQRALIGAELDNHSGRSDAGSAYVFEQDGSGVWLQAAKLTASDRASGDHFGTAVALGHDRALIGADGDDDQGSLSGSAYVFERDAAGAWREVAKLLPHDGAAFDARWRRPGWLGNGYRHLGSIADADHRADRAQRRRPCRGRLRYL